MKKWIYIIAEVRQPTLSHDFVEPGDISFTSVVVEATDESGAYLTGQRATGFGQSEQFAANDYVISFPEAA